MHTYHVSSRLHSDSTYYERRAELNATIEKLATGPIRDELTSVHLFNSNVGITQLETALFMAVNHLKDTVDIINLTTKEVRSFGPDADKQKIANILLRGTGRSTLASMSQPRNALMGLPPRKPPYS